MSDYCEDDYYGEQGCCLTCPCAEEGCLCYDCKCTKCDWYDSEEKCTYPRENWLTWEDYEEMAEAVKRKALLTYGHELVNVSALFSNGTDTKTLYYCNVLDVAPKILTCLPNGSWRTLLLKEIKQEDWFCTSPVRRTELKADVAPELVVCSKEVESDE